jgi:hypothetical protein
MAGCQVSNSQSLYLILHRMRHTILKEFCNVTFFVVEENWAWTDLLTHLKSEKI